MMIKLKEKALSHLGLFLCVMACFALLWGCATVPKETDVLARVDGETITVEDLIYSLNVSHRLEDLSSAGQLDLSGFVQRLVDELLVVQEARRMGMEEYPELRKKVDAFVLRESVVRLYNEEIVDKSPVTDEEVRERFMHDYETFTLGMISLTTQEDAAAVQERLAAGEDFAELARETSVDYSRDNGERTLRRREMALALQETVTGLAAGEVSGIVSAGDKFFYIVKLVDRQKASEEEFEHLGKNIKRQLKKLKTKKRSDEYLAELRSGADIEIDRELLDSLELEDEKAVHEGLKDKRVLVRVNDSVLTAGEFTAGVISARISSRERALNNWIDIQVVDDEALRREYALKSDLKGELRRYERQLLKKVFANRVVASEITVSLEEMRAYYDDHLQDFIKPTRYKTQQITLKTKEDAENVLHSLEGGASFTWLAKKKSKDEFASKGGYAGWRKEDEFLASEAGAIDKMKSGDISSILEVEGLFRIIRLQEKGETEFEDFGAVRQLVQDRVFREKFKKIYDEYVERLKEAARIEVYEEALEGYKARLRR